MDKAVEIKTDLFRADKFSGSDRGADRAQAAERVSKGRRGGEAQARRLAGVDAPVRFRDDYDPRAIRFSRHDGC